MRKRGSASEKRVPETVFFTTKIMVLMAERMIFVFEKIVFVAE